MSTADLWGTTIVSNLFLKEAKSLGCPENFKGSGLFNLMGVPDSDSLKVELRMCGDVVFLLEFNF